MDRAFDPWSATNENYYWELSRALYAKDVPALEAVLAKYDIRYVLLDEHLVSVSHNRALFTRETKELLAGIPMVKEIGRFGDLTLYERTDEDTQSFISIKADLPTVSPVYQWTDNDVAYQQLGSYITEATENTKIDLSKNAIAQMDKFIFPYRSLFTKRSVNERDFDVDAVRSKASELVYDSNVTNDLRAEAVTTCGLLKEGTAEAQNLDESGVQFLRLTSKNQRNCLSFGVNDLPHADGYLVEVESRRVAGRPLLFSLINQTAKHVELETYLTAQPEKASPFQASYFILPPLTPDGLGYTVYLSNDSIGSASAKASADRRHESVNDIKSIKFYRIPYQKLVSLKQEIAASPTVPRNDNITVSHPNPAFYKVSMRLPAGEADQRINASAQDTDASDALTPLTLILSQSFDPGWIALQKTGHFPFVAPIKDHVLVNNWANAWLLPSEQLNNASKTGYLEKQTIIIFFLPQLLEWLGLALLPLPFLFGKKLAS